MQHGPKSTPPYNLRRLATAVAAVLLCCLTAGQCASQSRIPDPRFIPYRFDTPDTTFRLHRSLEEISGLTAVGDSLLGAVEDERGRLYLLDPETGSIVDRVKLASDADYEGVEVVGTRAILLRSNGNLVDSPDWTAGDRDARTIKTQLKARNDTEGLAFDADRQRLLIACKEDPGAGLGPGTRAIYEFRLADSVLTPEPVYVIEASSIRRFFSDGDGSAKLFMRRASRTFGFKPSAIAIHPRSRNVYVLSSVWKGIAVLDTTGTVIDIAVLPDRLFRQPEGLTFVGDVLWIADEGAGKRSRLHKFAPVSRTQ